jgi:hypothetical protein
MIRSNYKGESHVEKTFINRYFDITVDIRQ